jgi:Ca-activated chloride channel family protein
MAGLDKPLVLAGSEDTVLVKVGLQGDELLLNNKRLPMNIAIVLDHSGSMNSQNKLENAKQGAIEIVDRLTSEDIVSLVIYDDRAQVLLPAQRASDKRRITDIIRSVQTGGSTALYAGVSLGAEELRKNIGQGHLSRIVLLSDGLANVGPQSTEELAGLGSELSRDDIAVSTVGVGLDYNEDLMTALAAQGSGNSYFAENSDELPDIFAEEIGEAMTVLASKINMRLECAEDVVPQAVLGRTASIQGRQASVKINNLYGKNEKYALFELKVPKGAAGSQRELAKIEVEYFNPLTKEQVKEVKTVSISYSLDRTAVEQNMDKKVLKEAALTKASQAKQDAIRLADQGQYQQASQVMAAQATMLEKVAAQCNNDKAMLDESAKLKVTYSNMESRKGLSRYERKRLANEAYMQEGQQFYAPAKESK